MPRSAPKRDHAFDQKLKDIELEKKRVQDEIKALSRALKKGEAPKSSPPVARPVAGLPSAAGPAAPAHTERDLFAWTAGADKQPSTSSSHAERPSIRDRRPPVRGDERFANYFSTGGFKSPLTARKEKSVQRNKAIFMLVVLALVAYIVWHAVVR